MLRARDFHKKEKALQILREKAEFRNPDEFYFRMQKSRTVDGVHAGISEPVAYSQEQILLMKTQDKKYVDMKTQMERKKVDKLHANLHYLGDAPVNKHIVFVDGEKEKREFDPVKYFDTSSEFVDKSFHRPRTSQLAESSQSIFRVHKKKKPKAYKELSQRNQRKRDLEEAALRMEIERAAMGKGRKRKIFKASENGGKPVYKWKKERKR